MLLGLAFVHGVLLVGAALGLRRLHDRPHPRVRRAEGIGYWGLTTIAAIAVAPTIGFWLYRAGAGRWLCASAGALNLVMAAIAWQLKEAEPAPRRRRFSARRLIEWRVLILSLTLFLYSFGYGGITSFVALYAD